VLGGQGLGSALGTRESWLRAQQEGEESPLRDPAALSS
jgi:hypothetical protein